MAGAKERGNKGTGTDDRATTSLPVTGEVGSEGGSYADPTTQVSEFDGDVGVTSEAAEPGKGDAQTGDAIKYPTE